MLDFVSKNYHIILILLVVGYLVFTLLGTASDEDIRKHLEIPSTVVIDVRSAGEFRGGSFPSALNIAHSDISSSLNRLPQDKKNPIIVFCASGMRSSSALSSLKKMGFTNVLNAGSYNNMMRFK